MWPQLGALKEAQHHFGYSRGVGPKAAPHRGHGRGGQHFECFIINTWHLGALVKGQLVGPGEIVSGGSHRA